MDLGLIGLRFCQMRLFLIIWIWVSVTAVAWGQSRADKLFERGDYLEALKIYQKEMESLGGSESEKADLLKMRVANCFFHLNDVVRAGQVYKMVNPDLLGAEDLTCYAITLLHAGDYEKAASQIELAESLGADPIVVERVKGSCQFAAVVAREKPIYAANKTKIDFAGFSSGVTYYKGRSVILAAPGTGENAVKDSRGYKVTRLYNAVFTGDGTSGRLLPFADELADKYHIGAVTFTKDYKRIYYTRTILKKDGTSILKLMTAEEEGGKWGHVEELSINSDDYSCAHPCLYRDSLLFFVSDMPGGLGGKDIYMTEIRGAQCGEIRNLGTQINTMSDELFPFMAEDGKLYFASNGHIGLGGLDVFVSQMDPDGSWEQPQNMGRPINSSMDDFALVFRDTDCTDGYVSSNRGGTGYNDFLYALKQLPTQITPERMLIRNEPKTMVAQRPQKKWAEQEREPQKPVQEVQRYEKENVQQEIPQSEMFTVDYRYAIQIGAFRNPVPRVFFENLQNVKVYLGYDNIYRYAVGEYPDEQLAQMELPQVQKHVKDAFVIHVERYVQQRKIQNDRRGDNISDDELLLRRLKNFDKSDKTKRIPLAPEPRTLDKPQDNEVKIADKGYTVVLMSADRMFDPTEFKGIQNVDVFAVSKGKYMYCAGLFETIEQASAELNKAQNHGFRNAYILRRKGGEFYTESIPAPAPVPAPKAVPASRKNGDDLKKILNF